MRFNVLMRAFKGLANLYVPLRVLPTLSPNPSLAQRAREGGQQPHLISSRRLAFYWRNTPKPIYAKNTSLANFPKQWPVVP